MGRLAASGLPSLQFFFERAGLEHDSYSCVARDIHDVVAHRLVLWGLSSGLEVLQARNLVVAADDDPIGPKAPDVVMAVVALLTYKS